MTTTPSGLGETAKLYAAYRGLMNSPTARAVAATTDTDIRRFWSKVALPEENGCLLWQARRFPNGYPCFKIAGRNTGGHRLLLWIFEGPPPSIAMQAAHSCNVPACVNLQHLRWATPGENTREQDVHGTRRRGSDSVNAKLTDGAVVEIRQRYAAGGVRQVDLASEYGVSQHAISRVVRRASWAHLRSEVSA